MKFFTSTLYKVEINLVMLSKKPILTVNEGTPVGHHFIDKNKIFIISKRSFCMTVHLASGSP